MTTTETKAMEATAALAALAAARGQWLTALAFSFFVGVGFLWVGLGSLLDR